MGSAERGLPRHTCNSSIGLLRRKEDPRMYAYPAGLEAPSPEEQGQTLKKPRWDFQMLGWEGPGSSFASDRRVWGPTKARIDKSAGFQLRRVPMSTCTRFEARECALSDALMLRDLQHRPCRTCGRYARGTGLFSTNCATIWLLECCCSRLPTTTVDCGFEVALGALLMVSVPRSSQPFVHVSRHYACARSKCGVPGPAATMLRPSTRTPRIRPSSRPPLRTSLSSCERHRWGGLDILGILCARPYYYYTPTTLQAKVEAMERYKELLDTTDEREIPVLEGAVLIARHKYPRRVSAAHTPAGVGVLDSLFSLPGWTSGTLTPSWTGLLPWCGCRRRGTPSA